MHNEPSYPHFIEELKGTSRRIFVLEIFVMIWDAWKRFLPDKKMYDPTISHERKLGTITL